VLVRKRGGTDNGRLYAMKIMKKVDIIKDKKTYEHTKTERHVSAEIRGAILGKVTLGLPNGSQSTPGNG
jgi:hypothetical protein